MKPADFSERDAAAKVVFFVPLWKRKGISLELFDDYWRDVHGPVCARLPGQYQYWQYHVSHNDGGIFPEIEGISYATPAPDQFDGIAELTFINADDRNTWFQAAAILMDDEHNIFSQAIGYNTSPGNSKTLVDGISIGSPNGEALPGMVVLYVMLKQKSGIAPTMFRDYLFDKFAPALAQSEYALKVRLNVFDEVDSTRPPAAGVAHAEPADSSYQACLELAFASNLEMEQFFQSQAYLSTIADQPSHIRQISTFRLRNAYTFVYGGKMTLTGQRGSSTANLITSIGAVNQIQEDILDLILGKGVR